MRPSCATDISAFCPLPFVELWQSLPSRASIISPFVDHLIAVIVSFRAREGSELDIEMARREALANAIVHGNSQDPHKPARAACRCTTDGEVPITIQAVGHGPQASALPEPTSTQDRLRTCGRGVHVMRASINEVRFDQGDAVLCKPKAPNARPQTDRKTA